jgi:hypothetical protein
MFSLSFTVPLFHFRDIACWLLNKQLDFQEVKSKVQKIMIKNLVVKPNLRNQQRVDVATEVKIEKPDGSSLVCSVSNISRAGFMISCGQDEVQTLIPAQQTPAPGAWIEVTAAFSVPVVASQPVSVVAHGHIVHMRRISRNEFQIGVQFAEFEGNGFEYVDNYVSKLLAASAL